MTKDEGLALWPCPGVTPHDEPGGSSVFDTSGSKSQHDSPVSDDRFPKTMMQRASADLPAMRSGETPFHTDMNRANDRCSPRCDVEDSFYTTSESEITTSQKKTKKKSKEKRKLETSALRGAHDYLQALREEVDAGKKTLLNEYNSLAHRIDEVSLSQQELMYKFEACLKDKSFEENSQQLRDLWQTCCHGVTAFHARLSRIDQLVDLSNLPQARLTAAEASFADEGQIIMEALPDNEKLAEVGLPTKSALIDKLSRQKRELGFMRENLGELEFEHAEESDQRDFLLDRGDRPEISNFRFEQEYYDEKRLTLWNLTQANAKIAELEKACIERGFDIAAEEGQQGIYTGRVLTEPPCSDNSSRSKMHQSPNSQPGVIAWIEKMRGQDQDEPAPLPGSSGASVALDAHQRTTSLTTG